MDREECQRLIVEQHDMIVALTKSVETLTDNINTICKVLHLVPITEKEEKELQILQRNNLKQAAKVNGDLNDMEKPEPESTDMPLNAVYSDVLGPEFLK